MLTYRSPSCSKASYSWHSTNYLMQFHKHSTKDIVRASWRPLLASNICRGSFDRIPRIIHSFSRIWWNQRLCMQNDKRKYGIVKIVVSISYIKGMYWYGVVLKVKVWFRFYKKNSRFYLIITLLCRHSPI